MEAAVYTRYGPPDVIQIKDLAKPGPKDDEVLIKVRAAGLNPLDGGMILRRTIPTWSFGKAQRCIQATITGLFAI